VELGQKAKILVVDDEPDITTVMQRALEMAGYKVDTLNKPEHVLSNFKNGYYDMLILDIRMPKMNGFQLYREIRKRDGNIKVYFMTSFEVYREEFDKMFPHYDAKCFISKRVGMKELQKIVEMELKKLSGQGSGRSI
jgi:DNA-binding NtrC family response regulator